MRVLSLIEGRAVSSPAKIVLTFARECRAQVDLTAATFVRPGAAADTPATTPLMEAARSMGVPIVSIPETGRFDTGALAELKRTLRTFRPDIVQTNSIKSHFLVSLLRRRPFAWLAFHHGYTAEDVKMRLYNQLDRWSLRACDRVVTVCEAFASDIVRKGVDRKKISVVPNGIRPDFMTRDRAVMERTRARFGIAADQLVVLSAGRLSSEKGHRYLIEAVARLQHAAADRRVPNFKVLLAGAGLLEKTLREQVCAAGLEDRVLLIGHEPDIQPLLMIADLFVLPSLSEGSPMVLLESMAAGVPVLTTDVGGIPEAVTDGDSALLVRPADAAVMSDALLQLLSEPALRSKLAAGGRRRVTTAYSPELYNNRVLAAFESVLPRPVAGFPQEIQVRS